MKMFYQVIRIVQFVFFSIAIINCHPDVLDDDVYGEVVAAVEVVPEDVFCISISVESAEINTWVQQNVTPGQAAEITIQQLPVSLTTFVGAAFDTSCEALDPEALPTWTTDPVTVNIHPGTRHDIHLLFRQTGEANIVIDFDEQFLPLGEDRLFYQVMGEGPPLILLHDGLLNSRVWDLQLRSFKNHFTVIRYDRRGYGKSSAGTADHLAHEDLSALMDHLGLTVADFIGISGGGSVVLDFALTYPEKVNRIITVGAVVSGFVFSDEFMARTMANYEPLLTSGDMAATIENWLNDPYSIPLSRENDHIADLFRNAFFDWEKMAPTLGHVQPLAPPAVDRLHEIIAPTLVLIGEMDIADVHVNADLIATDIPGAEKVVVGGAGHLINLERPQLFDQLVLEFLAE